MSDAKSPSDLSMDEILAAIRRIIADDEQSSAAASASGAAVARGPSAAGAAAGAAGAGPSGPATAADVPARPAEDDVLELTDALNDDGTVRRLAPIGGSARLMADPSPETPPAAVADEPEPEQQAKPEPEPPHRDPAGPAPTATQAAAEDHLVSEVTSLAAAAALSRLASAPRTPREAPMVGDRPLDELVQDLLRPLLQTWLDENLPQLVERLVQAEIARIGRSGAG
jgi:cell pole-organizing protein PopZ